MAAAGGGSLLDQARHAMRSWVLKNIEKLAGHYGAEFNSLRAFEDRVFNETSSIDDYISKISTKMAILERPQSSSGIQHQGQMGNQTRLPTTVMQEQPQPQQQPHLMSNNHHQTHGGWQSNVARVQMITGVGEVNWREEMFQKISVLKNSFFSELTDFDRLLHNCQKTEEQLQSLPKKQADQYKRITKLKDAVRSALDLLQLQKSSIDEGMKVKFCKYESSIHSLLRFYRETKAKINEMNANRHNNQQEQPAGLPRQRITDRTPSSARRQNRTDNVIGQSEDKLRCRVESVVAKKKPIDRLINALRHSVEDDRTDVKRQKTRHVNSALANEIDAMNAKLIDTVVRIAGEKDGGTEIEFSYTAVSLAPDMKQLFAAYGTSPVKPVKLFVPADYPRSSPVVSNNNDDGDEQRRGMFGEISGMVSAAFHCALRELPPSMSVKQMASEWNSCVQMIMKKFAIRHGGGTFSSRHGQWMDCTVE
ncbi:uncharacterized protein LOC127757651 [Oryza glaberrima]|uniref:ARC105/Med15 mediator subunit C-terminal domain-containing protein n=1 Tax=Oryza glaberrima TaxID=4538 RepID=I1R587_ORYGL|nr:uncharacterized protein LOC127757651 [Oryza glaberrima]